MPQTIPVPVKDLKLDLHNFRTVPQKNEIEAVSAMISTSSDRFWALIESLSDDGYLPTESIIVMRGAKRLSSLTVKEGNRRVAALKILLGLLPITELTGVPADIVARVRNVSQQWRQENATAPCTIYESTEAETVDRIVKLTHGKGEKAGRDPWNAVARARHNKAMKKSEPGLDLLEKYLSKGKNVTEHQKSRWAGEYPLTVLDEAMRRLAPRLGVGKAAALARTYPAVIYRTELETILFDIGCNAIRFEIIRSRDADFATAYGIPDPAANAGGATKGTAAATSGSNGRRGTRAKVPGKAKRKAVAISDPKAVRRILRAFAPAGKNREKVVTLKREAQQLDVGKTPLAFSFVLRSMFEISAKAYCSDHARAADGPKNTKSNGSDRALVDVLGDITKHLTKNSTNMAMVKTLHGAMTELGKAAGILSVTSMNQLVHNPKFSVTPGEVATRFVNVFPLLEAMNS